jgi:hypothetical protein
LPALFLLFLGRPHTFAPTLTTRCAPHIIAASQ